MMQEEKQLDFRQNVDKKKGYLRSRKGNSLSYVPEGEDTTSSIGKRKKRSLGSWVQKETL